MNYGFKKPIIDDTHYTFGDARLGAVTVKPDGDWTDWLPSYEAQADLYETYGCTVWGSQNQLETFYKFLKGIEPNYSERFNYNLAKIETGGTDPQVSYETIRKNGVIPQESMMLPTTLAEFRTPRPMVEPYLSEGKAFLKKYAYGHDWVLKGNESQADRISKLKAGLQFSPLGVSVTAWFEQDGVYVDNGISNNHWCMLYKIDDKYLYIFDSYDHSKKLLPHSHVISYAKRITLVETVEEMKLSLIEQIIQAIKKLLGLDTLVLEQIQSPVKTPTLKEKLLKMVNKSIGTDASPLNLAPEEYSCAEGASNIISAAIPQFPSSVLSTAQLKVCLDDCLYFERVREPVTGDIIVSPRKLSTFGHCGFIVDGGIISNDSNTGTMQKNYTWNSWVKEFKENRQLKIYLWRLKVGL